MTVDDIDQSCPSDLEPYELAHKKELIENDIFQHVWYGHYGISALSVVLDSFFSGKKAKTKYLQKPLLFNDSFSEKNYEESNEEVALFEMKQRIAMLKKQGLPESPV